MGRVRPKYKRRPDYRCGAKAKQHVGTCRNRVVVEGKRCRFHGGAKGIGRPTTHGAYSRTAAVLRHFSEADWELLGETISEGSTELALRVLWVRIDGLEARFRSGELSEGTYLRGLMLLLDEVRKLEQSMASNKAALARAGLDESVRGKIAEGDRMLRELICAAKADAKKRLDALPDDGDLDQLVDRPDLKLVFEQ